LVLTEDARREDDIHASIASAFDKLLLPPAVWTTLAVGGYALSPAAAARLERLGTKAGWPDAIILWPGNVAGIEIKRVGGRLSETRIVRGRNGCLRIRVGQKEMHPLLVAAGMRLAVCNDEFEALNQLRAWGCPMRRAAGI
jgi:hypothetical protein